MIRSTFLILWSRRTVYRKQMHNTFLFHPTHRHCFTAAVINNFTLQHSAYCELCIYLLCRNMLVFSMLKRFWIKKTILMNYGANRANHLMQCTWIWSRIQTFFSVNQIPNTIVLHQNGKCIRIKTISTFEISMIGNDTHSDEFHFCFVGNVCLLNSNTYKL